jgi:DNA-binding CsgD family transcriptional regulator
MVAPISPRSLQAGTISNRLSPAPISLEDSLANDHLVAATQLMLDPGQVLAGIMVFVSGAPWEPNRSYVIDVAGCARSRAAYRSLADRLTADLGNRASPEAVRQYFEKAIDEHPPLNGEAAFSITPSEAGSLIFLLKARSMHPDWRPKVEERLHIVAPLLIELAGAERTKERALQRLSVLESTLDEMSIAVFMLDAQSRPFCLNAAAFARLAMGDAFGLTHKGVLSCVFGRDTLALHEAVRRIVNAPPGGLKEEPLLITTRDGERAIATLRGVRADGPESDNRAALLMVQHEVRLSRGALDALGLTASEQRFLSTFLYCSSLASTAERLNLSDETARTYLKRICSKLGVRKQAELVALIWNLSPPLRQKPDIADSTAPGALGKLSRNQPSTR